MPVVLDFEGLGDFEEVDEFYNGGTGGSGSGPGPDFDITFSAGSLSIIDADAGGSGNFANEPTPDTVLFFLDAGSAIMNVLGGFDTGFSFFYSSVSFEGSVDVYDGLDGTGSLLASLVLPANGSSCGGDPNGSFNCWDPIGVAFAGTAMSVDFGGTANQIAYDNITLGADVPVGGVPEPSSVLLLAGGLLLFGARVRSRRRRR